MTHPDYRQLNAEADQLMEDQRLGLDELDINDDDAPNGVCEQCSDWLYEDGSCPSCDYDDARNYIGEEEE